MAAVFLRSTPPSRRLSDKAIRATPGKSFPPGRPPPGSFLRTATLKARNTRLPTPAGRAPAPIAWGVLRTESTPPTRHLPARPEQNTLASPPAWRCSMSWRRVRRTAGRKPSWQRLDALGFGGRCLLIVTVLGAKALGIEALFTQVAHQYRDGAVRDHYPLSASLFDCPEQTRPVCVIGQYETAIHPASPTRSAQAHPAAGETVAVVAETTHPGAATGRRRSDDQRFAQNRIALLEVARVERWWQVYAGLAIDTVQRLHRVMRQDRSEAGIDAMENA